MSTGTEFNNAKEVLLIDDDHDIREAFSEALEIEGFAVTSASDGSEALRLLTNGKYSPCLILVDLIMPKMDGASFVQALRAQKRFSEIPTILFTAAAQGHHTVEDVRHMVHEVIEKPADIHKLLQVVQLHCGEAA